MRYITSLLITLLFVQSVLTPDASAADESSRSPAADSLKWTPAEHDARVAWWREARFGMFVHWGVYSTLGGTWQGKAVKGYGEHIQRMLKIPIPTYRSEVAGSFNPTEFNADEWIRQAKNAGMGYFVITAKHHDGFAMFDSKVSDYNVVKATPFHRDPMKELRAACTKYGVRFGFYYSHAFDWGEENAPGNDWDYNNPGGDKLLHGADWWLTYPEFLPKVQKYVDGKSIPQVLELIANYSPDILWFDTAHKLPPEENLRIFAAVRKANPNVVINGRIFSGAMRETEGLVDYLDTADRPAEFPPHEGDWEGVPTTNESYGYNQNDKSHKPPGYFVRLLAKACARGGNTLMNVGPMGTGKMDPADIAILQGIGAWWQVNSESIRGTIRTPLPVQAWGESTRKGNTIYLHVFEWPADGRLTVGGLKTEVTKARLLGNSTGLKVSRLNSLDIVIEGLPKDAPDASDSVIAVECAGEPQGDKVRLLGTMPGTDTLRAFDGEMQGKLTYGSGKANDALVKGWTSTDQAVTWPVRVNATATFEVSIVYDAPAVSKSRRVEGDAGKESSGQKGAGGAYTVTLGTGIFSKAVHTGTAVTEDLGRVTLGPGSYELRVAAKEITAKELLQLQAVKLKRASE